MHGGYASCDVFYFFISLCGVLLFVVCREVLVDKIDLGGLLSAVLHSSTHTYSPHHYDYDFH